MLFLIDEAESFMRSLGGHYQSSLSRSNILEDNVEGDTEMGDMKAFLFCATTKRLPKL